MIRAARREVDGLPIAREWFAVEEVAHGVWSISEPHLHPLIRANAYLVGGRERDLLVDAGNGLASIREALEHRGLLREGLIAVATHAHSDHIGGLHEIDTRLVHPAEAAGLVEPELPTLRSASFGAAFVRWYEAADGKALPPFLADALPSADFDPEAWRVRPAPASGFAGEGDVIELGDRAVEVLHLPGHSPGQIGLLERRERLLFTGDAVYDGPLLDEYVHGADIAAYVRTMRRLRTLEIELVLPGHEGQFGRRRLAELADAYVERRTRRPKG